MGSLLPWSRRPRRPDRRRRQRWRDPPANVAGLLGWWLTGATDYPVRDDTTVHDEPAAVITGLPLGDPAAHWTGLYDKAPDRPRAAHRRLQRALRDAGGG